jgi:ketosteroid isomerase-like protein
MENFEVKMAEHELKEKRIEIVKNFYAKLDQADASLLDLFAEDVVLFFPKFGTAQGKSSLGELGKRFALEIDKIQHIQDAFAFLSDGDTIVLEGQMRGVMQNGDRWPTSEAGRHHFCTVFVFEDLLIKRVSIYLDPDFNLEDKKRVSNYRQTVKAEPS